MEPVDIAQCEEEACCEHPESDGPDEEKASPSRARSTGPRTSRVLDARGFQRFKLDVVIIASAHSPTVLQAEHSVEYRAAVMARVSRSSSRGL